MIKNKSYYLKKYYIFDQRRKFIGYNTEVSKLKNGTNFTKIFNYCNQTIY
jgi:hypothetical protein